MFKFEPTEEKRQIIDLIINESRHRKIVPFIGSGISFSTGFPTIVPIIHYLAKVDFAIRVGLYRERFPPLRNDHGKGQDELVDYYRLHPSRYVRDFGWPNFGTLDADLWAWLEKQKNISYPKLESLPKYEELINDLQQLEERDHLIALVQWNLRREQEQRDEGTAIGIASEWERWKKWRIGEEVINNLDQPSLLYGDWEMLLDKLCEGDFGLVDRLFYEFEKGLFPAQAHRLLALLQPKLGIPLVLTTNFDSFLERAFTEEGLTPRVFDIHKNAELPDPILVERQLSLLKLHGSAYGLRIGERLRNKLETDAGDYIKRYLPQNALILVLGFSGSERRMMQLLQSIVENPNDEFKRPRLIWLQGPGNPGPLYEELTTRESQEKEFKKIRSCRIKHADTFLQELYFKLASSHQASTKIYLSQPRQYLTELNIDLPKHEFNIFKKFYVNYLYKNTTHIPIKNAFEVYRNLKRRGLLKPDDLNYSPLQVFAVTDVAKQSDDDSGSLATLAATAFVQSTRQHRVIWIDLENHGTVESIIAEFFHCVKLVDPKSPSFSFSLLKSEKNDQAAKKLIEDTMNKAVDRICDVFQRGKYVLVLDSLESFGRPPMVHHGIPNLGTNDAELVDFKYQVKKLYILIIALVKKSNNFKDSYVVLTIDRPRQRHSGSNNNHAFKYLNRIIKKVYKIFKYDFSDCNNIDFRELNKGYGNFYINSANRNYAPKENPIEEIEEHWKFFNKELGTSSNDPEYYRSLSRANNVYYLIKLLRVQNCSGATSTKGIISAFVCLLAFFRRPRSIPLRHAAIDRWALRKIFGIPLKESDAEDSRLVVEHLLDLLTEEKTTVVEKENSNAGKLKFKSNGRKPNIGLPLLQILESKDKNAVGIVAQRHEGGTIWLFREVHEGTYCAITEFLHAKQWVNTWSKDAPDPNYNGIPAIFAILDGMICISWHLHIARAYYVDIFLPTHDIKAFYEYLYHRVSALRTITLLIALFASMKDDEQTKEHLNKVRENFDALMNESALKSELDDFKDSIIWYADVIGVFAEDPEYNSQRATTAENIKEYFVKRLISLRKNSLITLEKALQRNKDAFKASSVPEIITSWATQFIHREQPEIDGEIFNVPNIPSQIYSACKTKDTEDTDDNEIVCKIVSYFTDLNYMANLSRLDPESCMEEMKIGNNFNIESFLTGILDKFDLNNSEHQEEVKNILKFLIYINSAHATQFATDIYKKASDLSNNKGKEIAKEEFFRSVCALKSKVILANWSIWRPLRDRHLPSTRESIQLLIDAEDAAISYEDKLRTICTTSGTEATHRSDAFGVRARTLFLREHFNIGHRFLDLASSGLQFERPDHRSNAGIIHILRAELLATSAHVHYDKKLKEVYERTQSEVIELNDLVNEAYTSLKKVERAEQELNSAVELFGRISHLRLWSVFLEFGQAQVALERMLYEAEILALTYPKFGAKQNMVLNTEYLKRNGRLEQNILYCMGKLRKTLDLLPIRMDDWEQTKLKIEKYNNPDNRYPLLIDIERMCYGLWSDLFIVGAYFNSTLDVIFNDRPTLTMDMTPDEKVVVISGNMFSPENREFYLKRWEDWSHSIRFKNMSNSVRLNFSLTPQESKKTNHKYKYSEISLREKIIKDMKNANSPENIDRMWGARRPNL